MRSYFLAPLICITKSSSRADLWFKLFTHLAQILVRYQKKSCTLIAILPAYLYDYDLGTFRLSFSCFKRKSLAKKKHKTKGITNVCNLSILWTKKSLFLPPSLPSLFAVAIVLWESSSVLIEWNANNKSAIHSQEERHKNVLLFSLALFHDDNNSNEK